MEINYFVTIFPMEALIASQLTPEQFGSYMATGSKKGSAEQIIFAQVKGSFSEHFDWKYAEERCVPHPNGDPKHSVYLSVYRVLEHIPLDVIEKLFLTTRDGRTLVLEPEEYSAPAQSKKFFVYQELCPVHPVIVSSLEPHVFGKEITDNTGKVSVPKIVFADLKTPDLDNPDNSGHLGSMYDHKLGHLLDCIASVQGNSEKRNKTMDRSHVERFSFQLIKNAVYIQEGSIVLCFPMPGIDQIKEQDYDWGRSALLY
jgi:hypothetical protein